LGNAPKNTFKNIGIRRFIPSRFSINFSGHGARGC
jgi:hypothetical protein